MSVKVAETCLVWSKKLTNPENVGVVVGATDSVALARVRKICPDIWILCPGVGAQGGDPKVSVRSMCMYYARLIAIHSARY